MSQVFYKTYYHIVWGTKNKLPSINENIEERLRKHMPGKIKKIGGVLLAMNMVEDHIHLLLSIPPKISVSEFIHAIKGSSSHYVNQMQMEDKFYWQSGYGVLSLSEKGISFVKKYIENQKVKHRDGGIIEILEFISEEEPNSQIGTAQE